MGFRINTNVGALNAHRNSVMTNRSLDESLASLSSGLRINKAADDASGMAIADSLRSQAASLGQAISNANDGIGLIQTADGAMDEQLKILNTIKTKAIQAASDTQNADSREAIQKDVNRLIEQLDNIAKTTSFNGQVLLSGSYTNKEFQIGAYSNQTVQVSVSNTQSLAVGNIATRNDIVKLGNIASIDAAAAKGSTTISLSAGGNISQGANDMMGLAKGDTIRIDGVGNYTITELIGSTGSITLNTGLEKAITSGTNITIVSNVDETLAGYTYLTLTGTVITAGTTGDAAGFAVGDTIDISVTSSTGVASVVTRTITGINSQGTLTISAAAGTSTAVLDGFALGSRSTLGTAFSTSDYVQYSVEGTTLTGVQMTDTSGNGVADTGLGRVADLINETTDQTGIKAVAVVEQNGLISVDAGTLAANMTINGITIMEAGQSILAGDSDNGLINAINQKKDLTGATASLEPDGTLTLTSDGRAMNLSGFSTLTGINDGVHVGTLSMTKSGLEVMNVTSSHFSDAALTQTASNVDDLTEIVDSHVLRELVNGQVDSNGDGVIDNDDAVGLLKSQEGAMQAMDIVEAAIKELDAVRADLGSVQNQLTVTVNNISVTQVNVAAAESQLRDVDFAAVSSSFAKYNILAQSGSYALSQANAIQQNVLRLLQ